MTPSATFRLFHRAIVRREQVTFRYHGKPREVCPFVLGHGKADEEMVLAYQFGGLSSGGGALPDWRCFRLAEIEAPAVRRGAWHGDAAHRSRQQCVERVYVDVNTEVRDQPGRSPAALRELLAYPPAPPARDGNE
jgi:DNA-binding helix-hairpin-helix protein with protein kinase domain